MPVTGDIAHPDNACNVRFSRELHLFEPPAPIQKHAIALGLSRLRVVTTVREQQIHAPVTVDIGELDVVGPLCRFKEHAIGDVFPKHVLGSE